MIHPGAVDALVRILEEGVDVHRCAAAQALAHCPQDAAGAALRKALLDEDPDVRFDAVEALAAIGAGPHAPALMENLIGDPDPKVKQAVIEALTAIRHAPQLPVLRRLAVSRGDEDGIAWDESGFYEEGWDDWMDIQLQAIRGLGLMGDRAGVDVICAALDDEEGQDVSEFAIPALMAIGPDGFAALERRYEAADARFRRRVAGALAQCDSADAGGLLAKCLSDPEPEVRLRAIRANVALGLGSGPLIPMLDDPDEQVRALAVSELGPDRVEEVLRAMEDDSAAVRGAAFSVVARDPRRFDAQVVGERLAAAFAGNADISENAARAWAALDPSGAVEAVGTAANDARLPVDLRLRLIEVLRELGVAAVDRLLVAAADDDRTVRNAALAALGEMAAEMGAAPGNLAAYVLLEAAGGSILPESEMPSGDNAPDGTAEGEDHEGTEPEIDEEAGAEPASVAEEESGPEAGAPPPRSTLDAILHPPAAATAEEPVVELDLDEDDLRRLELVERRRIGKKRVSPDPDIPASVEVRRYAIGLLGEVRVPWVVEWLVPVLKDERADLRRAALESLARLAAAGCAVPVDEVLPVVTEILVAGDEPDRLSAIRLAAGLDEAEMPTILAALLADPSRAVRLEALRGLDRIGAAPGEVRAALTDEWPAVRLAAAGLLARVCREEAFEALFDFAFHDEGYHHVEAARLLAGIAPERAARAFAGVLADEGRKRVWQVAIEALGEIFARSPHPEDPVRRLA